VASWDFAIQKSSSANAWDGVKDDLCFSRSDSNHQLAGAQILAKSHEALSFWYFWLKPKVQ
jgi:hypothetical protein